MSPIDFTLGELDAIQAAMAGVPGSGHAHEAVQAKVRTAIRLGERVRPWGKWRGCGVTKTTCPGPGRRCGDCERKP